MRLHIVENHHWHHFEPEDSLDVDGHLFFQLLLVVLEKVCWTGQPKGSLLFIDPTRILRSFPKAWKFYTHVRQLLRLNTLNNLLNTYSNKTVVRWQYLLTLHAFEDSSKNGVKGINYRNTNFNRIITLRIQYVLMHIKCGRAFSVLSYTFHCRRKFI